jgi:hypothetical protein
MHGCNKIHRTQNIRHARVRTRQPLTLPFSLGSWTRATNVLPPRPFVCICRMTLIPSADVTQQPSLVPTWSPTEAPAELPTPTPVMTDAPTADAALASNSTTDAMVAQQAESAPTEAVNSTSTKPGALLAASEADRAENVTAALATTSVHVETDSESVSDRAGEVHAVTNANETSSQQPSLVPTWSPTDAPTALAELGRPPDEDPEAPPR